ncbi:MAG: alkaline phosphatase family protein [Planctomycetes bacterium]|nr:alkaline phosphatase family protein [Planctomycetota bacterium]
MPNTPSPRLALLAFSLLLAAPARPEGRVIVLGFDGADAHTAKALMEAGQMPNFRRLAETGTFAPLGTTTPNESPVAWASLNSSQNPGKTGVPGFVKRELGKDAPYPSAGHVTNEDRELAAMDLPPLWAFLGTNPPALVATYVGAACLLVFFLFFALLLRMKKGVAFALALVLGGVGAWAGHRASKAVPRVIEGVVGNPTQAGGFWEDAARAGVKSIVLEGAMTWDRPHVEGCHVLSGLGVPDARGANCDWAVYSTDAEAWAIAPQCKSTNTGGKVFKLEEQGGRFTSRLYGPTDLARIGALLHERRAIEAKVAANTAVDADLDRRDELRSELSALRPTDQSEEGRLSLPLEIEPRAGGAKVTIGSQSHDVGAGQWSKWYALTFDVNAMIKVRAVTRVKLVSLAAADAPLELYVDSLQIDPSFAPFWQPISQPPEFSAELAKAIGTAYETVGWACLTMPFKDKEIDTATFLEDIQFTAGWRKQLLDAAIARDDWRILMSVESTPDRVQHMLYQYYDEQHPRHDAKLADTRVQYFGKEVAYRDVIPATYRAMDELVGEVLDKHVKPGDTLIVCSDHGFQSFRRQFHLNNWLAKEGYLVLREGTTLADWDLLSFVDWSKTRVYSLGLGSLYVNLQGREARGIVPPAEKEALLAELTTKLLRVEDGGAKVVHNVLRPDQIHSGPHVALEADLMPGLAAGWRVSWKTTRGGIQLKSTPDRDDAFASEPFADNTNNWSGDHVSVADELVEGIFLCNRKVDAPADGYHLLDIAPTVLALVGVPIPAAYDRPPLRVQGAGAAR